MIKEINGMEVTSLPFAKIIHMLYSHEMPFWICFVVFSLDSPASNVFLSPTFPPESILNISPFSSATLATASKKACSAFDIPKTALKAPLHGTKVSVILSGPVSSVALVRNESFAAHVAGSCADLGGR